jgi:hypothetical protein
LADEIAPPDMKAALQLWRPTMVERYRPAKIVGYMNPPKQSQFKKGQSGNPQGRPKKKLTLADIIAEELDAKVFITENGERVKIEKSRIWVKRVINDAITKNSKDFIQLLKHQPTIDRFLAEKILTKLSHPDFSKLTLEERMKKMKELIASTKPLDEY